MREWLSRLSGRCANWPFPVGLVAFFLLVDGAMGPLMDWIDTGSFEAEIMWILGWMGVIAGQAVFVAAMSGFGCKSWLRGYLGGLLVCVLAFCAISVGQMFVSHPDPNEIAGFFMIPAFLFAAVTPLLFFHFVLGWRLAWEEEAPSAMLPVSLGDMFCLVALAAATLTFLQVPPVIWDEQDSDYWPAMVITCLVIATFSLVLIPIGVRLAFGRRQRSRIIFGFAVLMGISVLALFSVSQIFYAWDADWRDRLEVLPFILSAWVGLMASATIAILVLRRQKWAWRSHAWFRREGQLLVAPKESELREHRRWLRWSTGIMLLATGISAGWTGAVQSDRREKERFSAKYSKLANELGGSARVFERNLTYVKLGEGIGDHQLRMFEPCKHLVKIDLSDSQITNDGLRLLASFPELSDLNLAGTSITDEGLAHLAACPNLMRLDVSRTSVRLGWEPLIRTSSLITLDARDTLIDDLACEMLAELSGVTELCLRRTKITDHGLSILASALRLQSLDIGETQINGSGLRKLPSLTSLRADKTQYNDEAMETVGESTFLRILNLRETKVTDRGIRRLERCISLRQINFGELPLTDDAIVEFDDFGNVYSLDMSNSRITGSGFASWQGSDVGVLKLNGSLIDDENVQHLMRFSPLFELELAETPLTDKALSFLGNMQCGTVDLRGTRITANGLLITPRAFADEIWVTLHQFNDKELALLRQSGRVIRVFSSKDSTEALDEE